MIPRVIHFVFLVFKGKGPNMPEKWVKGDLDSGRAQSSLACHVRCAMSVACFELA